MASHLAPMCVAFFGSSYFAIASPTCYPSGGRFTQADWPYCFASGNNLVYSGKSADGNFMRLGLYAQGHSGAWSALAIGGNGGMKGARMIVVRKSACRNNDWIAEDRYSNAYAMPTLQNPQQVTLMFAEDQGGTTSWGVLLPMNCCSGHLDGLPTNYPLNDDIERPVLWALGSSHAFGYHTSSFTKRGVVVANLYSGPRSVPNTAGLDQIVLSMPNVNVQIGPNGNDAQNPFVCAVFDITQLTSRDFNVKQHVAVYEATLDNTSYQYVHHMVLHTCTQQPATPVGGTLLSHLDVVQDCAQMVKYCDSPIWGWAPGMKAWMPPQNVGFPVGSGRKWFAMQMHYYNPSLTPNVRDSSGVTMKLASGLRPIDAGGFSFNGGTNAGMRNPMPAGQQDVSLSMAAPSSCLQWGAGTSVNVMGVLFHEHQRGKSMNIDVFRGGSYLGPLRREHHYDYNFQGFQEGPVKTLNSGDELRLTCRFNTVGASQPVAFGENTQDEMCLATVLVWPAPPVFTNMWYQGASTPNTPIACHVSGTDQYFQNNPSQINIPACANIGNLASSAASAAVSECSSCQCPACNVSSLGACGVPSIPIQSTSGAPMTTAVTLLAFCMFIIDNMLL